jgi:hypothetical protein
MDALGSLTDMATHLNTIGRRALRDIATEVSPSHLEQFRLERLLELRAVIDALRSEAGSHPEAPLALSPLDPRSRQ